MVEIDKIFPIGIGTFRIDLSDKEKSMNSLLYSYKLGQNCIDASLLYEDGKVVEFIGEFLKTVDRKKLFVMAKLEKYIEKVSDIEDQLSRYLTLMDIDYVDCLELHTPNVTKLDLLETYKEMDRLVKLGKVRYLGISNCTLEQLKLINESYKLFKFEGVYNLECKIYEDNGVIDYCRKNDIMFVAYQPLRRNRTANRNYPLLVELSKKYKRTQNQVILNWIIKEKGMCVFVKAAKKYNITTNVESADFILEQADVERLNDFRSEEFDNIIVDWQENGGIAIHQLPNQFE